MLNQFYSCRTKRGELIGDYLDYEKTVENFEGPAFYCEYQFYNQFSKNNESLKKNYYQKHFWGILTTPYYGRTNLRLRHLASGMAMCCILDNYYKNWKKEYYASSNNFYNFFISKFEPKLVELPDLEMFYSMSKYFTEKEIAKHISEFQKFNSQPGKKVILEFKSTPQFRGFDPMHAEAVNDSTILHKTLLKLSNNDNELFIANRSVITLIKEQIWFVDKVILFVPDKSIEISYGKIHITTNGINIDWNGEVIKETENMIVIRCE